MSYLFSTASPRSNSSSSRRVKLDLPERENKLDSEPTTPTPDQRTGISLKYIEFDEKGDEYEVTEDEVATFVRKRKLIVKHRDFPSGRFSFPINRRLIKTFVLKTEGYSYTLAFRDNNGRDFKLLYEWESRRAKDLTEMQETPASPSLSRGFQSFEVSVVPKWGSVVEDYTFDPEQTASRNAVHIIDMVEHIQRIQVDSELSIML